MQEKTIRPNSYVDKDPSLGKIIEFINNQTEHLDDKQYIDWLFERRELADRGFKIVYSPDRDLECSFDSINQLGKRAVVNNLLYDNGLIITKESNHPLYVKYNKEFKKLLEHPILKYNLGNMEDEELVEFSKNNAKSSKIFTIFKLKGVQKRPVPVSGQVFEKVYFSLIPLIDSHNREIKLSSFIYPLIIPSTLEFPEYTRSTYNGTLIKNYDELYDLIDELDGELVLITNSWVGIGKFGANECINMVHLPAKDNIAEIIKNEFISEKIKFLNMLLDEPSKLFTFSPVDDLIISEVVKDYKTVIEEKLKAAIRGKKNREILFESHFQIESNFIDHKAIVKQYNRYHYGIINTFGEELLEQKYSEIYRTDKGLFKVRENDKWGFFDKNCNQLCDFKYDQIFKWDDGLSKVRIGYKWGLLDDNCNEICDIKYSEIDHFYDGIALAVDRDENDTFFTFINKSGKEIAKTKAEYYCVKIVRLVSKGLYEISQKRYDDWTVNPQYINIQGYIFDYVSQLLHERRWVKNHYGNYGYLNESGELVIPTIYESARDFVNEKALVSQNIQHKLSYFFIDKAGNKLKEVSNYDFVWSFDNGYYPVQINDLWGYINEDGKEVLKPKYSKTSHFKDGVAIVRNKDGYFGLINSELKEISDFIYAEINDFQNGIALATVNLKTKIDTFTNYTRTLTFLSLKGQELTSQRYITIDEFQNGMAEVLSLDNKYGFIDNEYKEIIPCIFLSVCPFDKDGYSKVCLNNEDNEWIVIDKNGNKISDTNNPHGYYEDPYTSDDAFRDASDGFFD